MCVRGGGWRVIQGQKKWMVWFWLTSGVTGMWQELGGQAQKMVRFARASREAACVLKKNV